MLGNGGKKKVSPSGNVTTKTKPKPGEPKKKPGTKPQRFLGLPRIARTLPHEDYLVTLFGQHVDMVSRTIFLQSIYASEDGNDESGTDAHMYACCMKAMTLLEQQDMKKPIKIITANGGGLIYYGLAIYDRIMLSPCHIIMHGYGKIMSMGSVIFQAGDERLLSPNATMMLHHGFDDIEVKDGNGDTKFAEHKRLDREGVDLYVDRIVQAGKKADRKKLDQMMRGTLFLPALQAVEMGLADGIITKP